MSRFLPASEIDYPIVDSSPTRFVRVEANLPNVIGRQMSIKRAGTETRIPSAFSRAYLFWIYLFDQALGGDMSSSAPNRDRQKTLESYRKEAQQTFRGLLALFALREVLNLDLQVVS